MTRDFVTTLPELWPMMALSSALLGVLANPQLDRKTLEFALGVIRAFSKTAQFNDENQPAAADVSSY
jgi:hypothetical protein